MIKPAYEKAYEMGFATGFLPKEYGGGGLTNIDVLIAVEEIGAVDPGFGCVLLVNGLALMPLVWFGNEEQKKKWLTEACNDPTKSLSRRLGGVGAGRQPGRHGKFRPSLTRRPASRSPPTSRTANTSSTGASIGRQAPPAGT